ncbi:MAG TPA: adenosine deaminase family protein [Methylomirabilota bacterium]|nr:adenosine deaminase family protein [Methylomirabilota bacterium]
MRTAEFIRALPKAEVHLHFEGAVPWAMVRAHSRGALPEHPAWWADGFRFEDFKQFRLASQTCLESLVDVAAYHRAAEAVFGGLRAQNVRYTEVSFDAVRLAAQELPFTDVIDAIKRGAPPGLTVRVFGAFAYHKHDTTPEDVIAATLNQANLDGISLHGDETVRSTARFADVFAEARHKRLLTKAHAGELSGPASITSALDLLGVRRIEHGVRAIEDEALVERLAADGVTLDMCPWSNVRLAVVRDLTAHPIRRLHARGVRVTVSTDDPTVFGRSLSEELASLVDDLGFALPEVAQLQSNAFAVAAMPADARAAVQRELDALVAEAESGRA